MDVGVVVAHDGRPGRGMAELAELAVAAEAAGLSSLWVPEHVVFVRGAVSRYPYNETGELRLGRQPGVYDPLVALAYVAARTDRLRLGTSILILPQREPLIVAQQIVALDHASGGRFDFGIGVGWLREEFDALGVPWERRGDRTDEYVEAMKVLWRDEVCDFEGEFVSFHEVLAYPKPLQQPHPPIWVGGNTSAAQRRAARLGDGWYAWQLSVPELASCIEGLDRACEGAGRNPSTVRRKLGLNWAGDLTELRPYAEQAAAHGFEELVVAPAAPGQDLRRRIEELAAIG